MYEQPWIGIDLDGTLAEYDPHMFPQIGKPVEPMRVFVQMLLNAGTEVRIFTARVGPHGAAYPDGTLIDPEFIPKQVAMIEAWCLAVFNRTLPVTATKDFQMIALYDDRAVQIVENRGIRVDGRALHALLIDAVG